MGKLLATLTKPISILHPVYACRSFRRRGIHVDVVEAYVGCVHHVDRPELGLNDVEIADVDVADIPQDEGHWATWAGGSYEGAFGFVAFVVVPDLAVAVDAAGAVAVDADVISCQDESGSVVLELDVV